MNCQLCQKNLDGYLEGTLPQGMKTQVESHIESCDSCRQVYNAELIADKVIIREKETEPDPFLVTRVMARIEDSELSGENSGFVGIRVIRPAVIALSLAAAVFLGIMIGNLTKPVSSVQKIPLELALINDAAMESVNILSNE